MSKKLIFMATLVTGVTSSALAATNNPVLTLGGIIDTQYGKVYEKNDFKHVDPTEPLDSEVRFNSGLVSDAKILIRVDGKTDCGMGYGGLIKLNAATSDDKYGDSYNAQQTMAYFEGMFGRLEAGSYTGASHALHVSANHVAKGTGGINGDWWLWINPKTGAYGANPSMANSFLLHPELFTNNIAFLGTQSVDSGIKYVNASKINYFTPTYYGWKAGISYIPDLESFGTINKASQVLSQISEGSHIMYHEIFEGGIHYAGKVKNVGFTAAWVGQSGTAKLSNLTEWGRKLRAWEGGAAVTYMNMTVAGAYGKHGRSGQILVSDAHPGKYWNAGASYEDGPFGVSVTYADMKHGYWQAPNAPNRMRTLAFGADYYLAPGMKAYIDVVNYRATDNTIGSNPTQSAKGNVVLVGSKLNF